MRQKLMPEALGKKIAPELLLQIGSLKLVPALADASQSKNEGPSLITLQLMGASENCHNGWFL
jgi:hypothetical protein